MSSRRFRVGPAELFLALLAAALLAPVADPDLWWHLAAGRQFCQHGLADTDPFSWLAQGRPWVTHEWLFEIVTWKLVQPFSDDDIGKPLATIQFILVLLPFVAWWRSWRQRRYHWLAVVIAGLVLWTLLNPSLLLRPHLLTFVFVIWLTTYLRRSRRGGLAVPLLYLWACLHAGFSVGLFVLGVAVACPPAARRLGRKRLLLVFLLALLATMATPLGPKLLLYPLQYLGDTQHSRWLDEWQRPDLLREPGFIAGVVVILAAFIAGRWYRPFDWALFLTFTLLALSSKRYFPVVAAVSVVPLTAALNLALRRVAALRPLRRRWRAFNPALGVPALPLIAILIGLTAIWWFPNRYGIDGRVFPTAAVDGLKRLHWVDAGQEISARVYTTYHWGGYLMFHLYPQYRTGMDGRADIFTESELADYARVVNAGPGWDRYLDDHQVAGVVIEPGAPLGAALAASPAWNEYAGGSARVFIRDRYHWNPIDRTGAGRDNELSTGARVSE